MKHLIKTTALVVLTVFTLSSAFIPSVVTPAEAGKLKKTFKKVRKGTKKEAKKGYSKSKWAGQKMKDGVVKGARATQSGAKKGAEKVKKWFRK